jgi:predicted permease
MESEFLYHLESLEAEHRARGLSVEQARQAARRDFGGLSQVREAYRDQRGVPMLETLWRDIRFGTRSMLRTPVVTAAVVATLGIGIGANTTIFSIVNAVLIKPLPYPDADRLINVSHSAPGVNIDDLGSAPYLYFAERELNHTFEGIGLWRTGTANVTGQGDPERVSSLSVTADVLPLLGIQPILGRYFSADDNASDAKPVAVLAYGYWQRRFGGDASAIGKRLTTNGTGLEIIGVMPQGFPPQVDVITLFRPSRSDVRTGAPYYFPSIARLKRGVTLEQAAADIARIVPLAIESFPPAPGTSHEQVKKTGLGPNLRRLKEDVVGDAGNTLWVLMGTIGMVLLVACANVANLILVRTEGRQNELSIRSALGAGRGRIARELLTENLILSAAGGLLGLAFAFIGLRLFLSIAPGNLPRLNEIVLDLPVLIFTLVITALSGLLFGLVPVARYAGPRLTAGLRSGSRTSGLSRDRLRTQGMLVVVQVGLALVLLVGAGLMIRTFHKLSQVHAGFERPEEIQTIRIDIPPPVAPDPQRVLQVLNDIRENIAALTGVSSVAFTSSTPMSGNAVDLLTPEGRVFTENDRPRLTQFKFVSPGYFTTAGITLIKGRDITWIETYEKHAVVLVSENLAVREWGGVDNALGKRLRGGFASDDWREIVGVVGNVHDSGLADDPTELVYVPLLVDRFQNVPTRVQRSVAYLIRSPRTGSPGFLDEIRGSLKSVSPILIPWRAAVMTEIFRDSTERTSFALVMLAIAGVMALLLGVIGIYGAISYGVSRRLREVGIRIALGAQNHEVQRMFLRRGLGLTAMGVMTGLGGAAALSQWMSSLLFEVSPLDPTTYAAVALLLVPAALLASYIPSRRATNIDPIKSLRGE